MISLSIDLSQDDPQGSASSIDLAEANVGSGPRGLQGWSCGKSEGVEMMKEKYAVLYDLSYRVHIYNFKYDHIVNAAIKDVIWVSSCDAYYNHVQ